MQVSEVHDHVNHAIIGGEESIDFGISNSAEFFHILSSTLYSDQILAVVREVMCNAWDEHLGGGLQDKPIRITVNSNEFIVQDFGRGIHKDDMGPIYGVYGNSTKKNDGTQTGGFGLGCKSPFAYTDHFEVTSAHDGMKTVYRLSKSAVQSGGKPGIFPIVSVPSTETGLTVKIGLKDSDHYRFLTLAKRIAQNGEMNAEINGSIQPKLGFDSAIRPYMIYKGIPLLESNSPTIYIRYGNVIYPCDSWPQELESLTSSVRSFVGSLAGETHYGADYKILFQAPAHSLSVTPSRESLSMQEHTIKTLKTLFVNFLADVEKYFKPACDKFVQESTEACVKAADFQDLLYRQLSLPGIDRDSTTMDTRVFSNFEEMAKQVMTVKYPRDVRFRKQDWERRITLMADNKLIDRGMAHTWLSHLKDVIYLNENYQWNHIGNSSWLSKRIIAPLLSKLAMEPTMESSKLYCVESVKASSRRYNSPMIDGAVPATKVRLKHHFDTAAYLRNIIVLARRKTDVFERAMQHPTFVNKFGKFHGFLFYHVGMKQEDAVNARAYFAKTRMTVVDLIDKQEWEAEAETDYVTSRPKEIKPRKKGLVTLGYLIQGQTYINTGDAYDNDADRIEKPEYVIRLVSGSKVPTSTFEEWDAETARMFATMFGDRGGVTFTQSQVEVYRKRGAKRSTEFLLDQVIDYFINNEAEIEKYWSTRTSRATCPVELDHEAQAHDLMRLIIAVPELKAEYKQTRHSLDATGKAYIKFYDMLGKDRFIKEDPRYIALKDALDKISLDPNIEDLIRKLNKCKLTEALNMYHLEKILSSPHYKTSDQALRNSLISLVKTVVDS